MAAHAERWQVVEAAAAKARGLGNGKVVAAKETWVPIEVCAFFTIDESGYARLTLSSEGHQFRNLASVRDA